MGAVSLDYATPDASLRDYISLFYEFRADVPHFEDMERADLAQFRFMLEGEGSLRFADGHEQASLKIFIIGPTTGMTKVSIKGPVHVFGCGLLPAGWAALLGIEASTLVNRVVDATELFGQGLHEVADRLRVAPTLDEKVAIASTLAHELMCGNRSTAFDFTRMVDDWLTSSPSPEVDDLVASSGVSRRQVERNCKRFYGSPPKVLARKYRALKAAIAIARHEAVPNDMLDNGFYDQSHFIREIKHFTGVTPKRIADDLPTLAALTLKRTEFEGLSPLVTRT